MKGRTLYRLGLSPIYGDGQKRRKSIDKIICAATDKTQEINLERQLEIDKQEAEFIKYCLQNPVEFIDLLDDTFDLLACYPKIDKKDDGELFQKVSHSWVPALGNLESRTSLIILMKLKVGFLEGRLKV